jgi:hypothetical protein
MTSSNDAFNPPQSPTCPLARDADGAAIALPDGAATWRVRRKTGGRPRIVLGVDKQPMQLPLAYTIVDLEDVLAPAEYLLDLVDMKGNGLGITVPISIGQLRNADGDGPADDGDASLAVATALPTSGSETRLVLEANVRATQMAFVHNQKTLELGLRMAETLRDGVRVMAESQADWIKSVSSARGFFRNAPPLPLPAPQVPSTHDEDEDDDDDDDNDAPVSEHWVDKLMPHVVPIVQLVVPMLTAKLSRRPNADGESQSKLELADLLDWRRPAAKRLAAEPAAPAPAVAEPTGLPPLDIQAAAHFLQIQQALTEHEATMARATAAHLTPPELRIWLDELKQLSVPDAVAKIRAFLASQSKPTA